GHLRRRLRDVRPEDRRAALSRVAGRQGDRAREATARARGGGPQGGRPRAGRGVQGRQDAPLGAAESLCSFRAGARATAPNDARTARRGGLLLIATRRNTRVNVAESAERLV